MKELHHLLLSENIGILTIKLNREDKLNALNMASMEEMKEIIQSVYDRDDIKGVIITGAGEKSFASGADIKEIKELNEMVGRKFSENGQELMLLIENCHKPIVAAVNGYAIGGGVELAMACHLRVACENASFALPEVKLGVIPAFGGTQRLVQLIGKGKAVELMMTGDTISAQEAKNLGLVNHLVSNPEELMYKCQKIMERIFKNAPLAVGMVINCVNMAFSGEENGYQTEANSFANCCKSDDFKEGVTAFLEKRSPQFKGE